MSLRSPRAAVASAAAFSRAVGSVGSAVAAPPALYRFDVVSPSYRPAPGFFAAVAPLGPAFAQRVYSLALSSLAEASLFPPALVLPFLRSAAGADLAAAIGSGLASGLSDLESVERAVRALAVGSTVEKEELASLSLPVGCSDLVYYVLRSIVVDRA
jgi:hypothetical protein